MKFTESVSACYVIDSSQSIVTFKNHDKRLFFDNEVVVGDSFIDVVDVQKNNGFQVVIDAVSRAIKYNRGVCQEYTSLYGDGKRVCVGLFGELNNDGEMTIYLNPMEKLDELVNDKIRSNKSSLLIPDEMREWLEVGIQVFNRDGILIGVNDHCLEDLGLDSEEDILGIDLFDNPYLTDVHKKELLRGHNVQFDVVLDNNKTDYYYKTKYTDVRSFRVIITIIYDNIGDVYRYLMITSDNSELIKLTDKYGNFKVLIDQVLNQIPMAILIKSIEDSRYVFCNDESNRMLNVVLGMRANDIVTAEFVEFIDKIDMGVYSSKKPYLGHERLRLKNGKEYETIVRKNLINYDNKPHILIVLWDEKIQNAFAQYSKLLHVLKNNTDADIWMVEFDDTDIVRDTEGSIINILNSDCDEAFNRIHSDDKQTALLSILKALSEGLNNWKAEFRADLNQEGVYKWSETIGIIDYIERNNKSYIQIFGISTSIEAQKQNEQILLDNQKKLNELVHQNTLIINNANSGLVYIDTEYNVLWDNLSVDSTRVPCGVFEKGKKCYNTAYNLDKPCSDCILKKVYATRNVEKKQMIFDDGAVVEMYVKPAFDNGRIEGFVVRLDDVTNREDMLKELQVAKFNAEESERLKSAFLANMSHEIRTPLNAIIGFSELMAEATAQECKEYFQIISMNSELLLKLINNIIDFSKIEAGTVDLNYEKMSMTDCFNHVVTSLESSIDSTRVKLVLDNRCDERLVSMDKDCILLLFINYLSNAIKYTANGIITVGCRYENNGLYLYVKDTGIGIDEDKKALVFNRFEKIDEFAQGTGLGLSICKGVVEAMEGQLGCKSTRNVGSLFWAFLPILENDID